LNNGLSRTQFATGVVTSSENGANSVRSLYAQYLHRAADDAGLAFWLVQLQHGKSINAITASIVGSSEYYNGV
jgi:hypothetical protein